MDIKKLKKVLTETLKQDARLWVDPQNKEFNETKLIDLVENYDEKIIGLLLKNKKLVDKFFVKIKSSYVFNTREFKFFIEENKIDNSYTRYRNRIGLTDGDRFLKDSRDIVLNWPYKDCILEGGQSTEEGTDRYYESSKNEKKYQEKKGSEFKPGNFKDFFDQPKIKYISKTKEQRENSALELREVLRKEDWFVTNEFMGTSEEQELIKFIQESLHELQVKYSEIYLLKNEEIYTIYNFNDGKGFQPDFLLFLKNKKKLNYQLIIEAKGDQFLDSDNLFAHSKEGWKEKFLKEITAKTKKNITLKAENEKYRLIGLPLFNSRTKERFIEEFSEKLDAGK